jgi:hypothetical protein
MREYLRLLVRFEIPGSSHHGKKEEMGVSAVTHVEQREVSGDERVAPAMESLEEE